MDKDKLRRLARTLNNQRHYRGVITVTSMRRGKDWKHIPEKFALAAVHVFLPRNDCRTVGCIIGYGLGLDGIGYKYGDFEDSPFTEFGHRFGLEMSVVNRLGNPFQITDYKSVTPQEAAQAVENVINGADTEEAIWGHVLERIKQEKAAKANHDWSVTSS